MAGFLTMVLGVLLLLLFFWAVAAVQLGVRVGPDARTALTRFGIVVMAIFLIVGGYLVFLYFSGSL